MANGAFNLEEWERQKYTEAWARPTGLPTGARVPVVPTTQPAPTIVGRPPMDFTKSNIEAGKGMTYSADTGQAEVPEPSIRSVAMPGGGTLYTNRGLPTLSGGGIDWETWRKGMPTSGTGTVTGTLTSGEEVSEMAYPGQKISGVDWSHVGYMQNTPPEKQYEDYLAEHKKQYPEGKITKPFGTYGGTVIEGEPLTFAEFKKDLPSRTDAVIKAMSPTSDKGLPSTGGIGGGISGADFSPSKEELEQRQQIQSTYKDVLTKMMSKGDALAKEIEQGLYHGKRLTAANEELKGIQESIPHILTGMSTYHKGIMDVDVDRLTKGKIAEEDLKYKLGLLPLEIEEKKAGIGEKKAATKTSEAHAGYYKEETEMARKKVAGLPTDYTEVAAEKERLARIAHPEKYTAEAQEDEFRKGRIEILKSTALPEEIAMKLISHYNTSGHFAQIATKTDKDGNIAHRVVDEKGTTVLEW